MGRARDLADLSSISTRLDTLGAIDGSLSNRNILINGSHQISQRHGTSSVTVSANDHFVVDRFKIQDYSDATFSSQQVSDAPVGFEYSSKLTVTGTDTDLGTTQYQRFVQPIEGTSISHLNWGSANAQTVTLSFHVKSSLTGTFYVFAFNSAANRSFVSAYTIDTANTWEKKIIKITGDQSGTWLTSTGVGMYLGWSLGTGTNFQTSTLDAWQGSFEMAGSDQVNFAATNGATWQVTGCQLELGDTVSDFEHEPVGVTLNKCRRYYNQVLKGAWGVASAAGSPVFHFFNTVEMRAAPSFSLTVNKVAMGDMISTGFNLTGASISAGTHNTSQVSVWTFTASSFSSTMTDYRPLLLESISGGSFNGEVQISAEL